VRRTSNLVGPIFMFDAFPDIGSSFRLVLEPVLASFKSGNIASTWAAGIVLSGLLLIVAFVGRVANMGGLFTLNGRIRQT
jgi:hypothetical protein